MHILSAEQFGRRELEDLFEATDRMRSDFAENRLALAQRHIGRQAALLFYEPSTRTRFSFSAGAQHLGMGVNSTENAKEFSSAAKGETLEDTLEMLNQYHADIIVIRHHETGAIAQAAGRIESAPIINAGDGKGEHPTQALLDTYTIHSEVGRTDDLKVVIGGDLKRGRTARSLAKMLSHFDGNHVTFVSTPELQVNDDIKLYLDNHETTYDIMNDPHEAVANADVIYWTRLQNERSDERAELFTIDEEFMKKVPAKTILMHPLPRVGEISPNVDRDPRAKYFSQAGNGMFVRMALMEKLLKD
jgi:aspartate carbamoyltransferase catalytic subunit